MEIQWSLVIFSSLVGMAGWMLAASAFDEVKGVNEKARPAAAAISLALLVVGGLASVTHLSHPTRVMGALSHPTSDIFYEALLTGLAAICIVVYLVLVRRDAKACPPVRGVVSHEDAHRPRRAVARRRI
ncbi:MAG: DmsC/YnfH family molybdoenzyme membrane anchor subunit [Slackia sp.]|uniref:DmsC/YnfH family molybdoenzyme membrane anchor subunit n=1 Tax=uncultured Slackia sp. TaxID=665903 RepID=UPI0028057792|nr:DmsC/YnfH family molybdoenzyme membrane anchor subunit [uncultured Slackia sp.]MDU6010874.1 DmsC/YnfH family molybdoenzyme membrane anchor subunit [Slackia sp.]